MAGVRLKATPLRRSSWQSCLCVLFSLYYHALALSVTISNAMVAGTDISLYPAVCSGPVWRQALTTDAYLPIIQAGWNFNLALHVCNSLGYGPPDENELTIRTSRRYITRSSDTVTLAGVHYTARRHFQMSCANLSQPCTAPTYTKLKSTLTGTEYQVKLRCNAKPLPVRIVSNNGAANTSYGLVQLYQRDKFRVVCGEGFGPLEAAVTCRGLGYDYGEVYSDSLATGATYNITERLSTTANFREHGPAAAFECDGSEASLSMCSHANARGWELVRCGTLAAVICSMSAGTSPSTGAASTVAAVTSESSTGAAALPEFSLKPAITEGGLWKDVQGTMYPIVATAWDFNKALYACKTQNLGPPTNVFSVGFPDINGLGPNVTLHGVPYSSWQGVEWVCESGGACRSPSTHVISSPASLKQARLTCYNTPLQARIVTASGDSHRHYGIVQLQRDNTFQPVCGHGWGATQATVVCRELGYVGGLPLTTATASAFNLSDLPSPTPLFPQYGLVRGLECDGTETRLSMCAHAAAGIWEPGVLCNTVAAVVCDTTGKSTGDHLAVTVGGGIKVTATSSVTSEEQTLATSQSPTHTQLSTGPSTEPSTESAAEPSVESSKEPTTEPPSTEDGDHRSSGSNSDASTNTIYLAVIIALGGVLLFVLFIVLICVMHHRRRQRQQHKEREDDEDKSKSRTVSSHTITTLATSFQAGHLRDMRSRPVPESPLSSTSGTEGTTFRHGGGHAALNKSASGDLVMHAALNKSVSGDFVMDGAECDYSSRYTAGPVRVALGLTAGGDRGDPDHTYFSIPTKHAGSSENVSIAGMEDTYGTSI
eukprot:scpid41950/ scgid3178/ 